MSSKMMLLGLNTFVLLAIVTGARNSSIIFEDSLPNLMSDKISPNNITVQPPNNVQLPNNNAQLPNKPFQPPNDHIIQLPNNHVEPSNNADQPPYNRVQLPNNRIQLPNNTIQQQNYVPLQYYIQPPVRVTPPDSESKKKVWILGLLNAALNIDKSLHSLNAREPKLDQNIVVSPLCIAAAIALILLGSRGESKMEIDRLFDFTGNTLLSTDNNYQNYKDLGELLSYFEDNNTGLGTQVNLAKAIFVQNNYNISKFYKLAITEYVPSELIAVDFKLNGQQAQQTINQWVSNKTHGKIDFIMPDIPLPDTKTVITSALYFAGEWEHPFFVNYTRMKQFYLEPNSEGRKTPKQTKDFVYVSMMVGNSEVLYHRNDELEFKAIGLPYKGKKFVAYFVLPNSNVSLRELVSKMNRESLINITKNTKTTEFTYFVPKMTLESFTNLRPVLQNLGINKIFNPLEADLSNMASEPSYISDILHKVEIVINEVGTVASAATVVTITRGGQSTFSVNKPFLFFIHCIETDTIIFWGTIHKPTPYSTLSSNLSTFKKT